MTQTTPLSRLLNAGSEVLHEKIAEAFEPEWQELIRRMFAAMRRQEMAEIYPELGVK
jgi:hypothetical protein